MKTVSQQWLEETNEELRQQGITDSEQKTRLAISKWNNEVVFKKADDNSIDPKQIELQKNKIKSFFLTQTSRNTGLVEPPFIGIYYYYGNFWNIVIPRIMGKVGINLFDCLKMTQDVKELLFSDEDSVTEYIEVCADSFDYGYGIEEVDRKCNNDFSKELFKSADKHLLATISLLNQEKVSSKSIEDARMSLEIFLKAYLSVKENLIDTDLRKQIGHNLDTAIDRCIANGLSELTQIKPKLVLFPQVQGRYEAPELTFGVLWSAYKLAHKTGTTILRDLTGRDMRGSIVMKKSKPAKVNCLSLIKYISTNLSSSYFFTNIVTENRFTDVYLDVSANKLDEIINIALGDKVSNLDVLIVGSVIFGTHGRGEPFLGNHVTISLTFKTTANFVKASITNSNTKSYKQLEFYTNTLGYTEILELTDGIEVNLYIEKKYIPEWR